MGEEGRVGKWRGGKGKGGELSRGQGMGGKGELMGEQGIGAEHMVGE